MTDDPRRTEVKTPRPFSTKNLPYANHMRAFVCQDPKCGHLHVVGFSADEEALFHFTCDKPMLDCWYEVLTFLPHG